MQVNWDTLATFRGQYVRLENATVEARDVSTTRPNWLVSTDGDLTVLNFYDISLRFRNDRAGDYPLTFNVRDFEFVPPPLGSEIYIQGFLVFQNDDPFARGIPDGALLSIVPFEDSDIPATRFVDPSGSDGGNDCTDISNPCQTISHAASISSAFDSLVIEAGTYSEPGLVIDKRLNIAAQGVIVQ